MKYSKETSRLVVQIIDSETEEVIGTINNKNWSNVGEVFSDYYVTEIMKAKKVSPENIILLVSAEFKKQTS